MTIFLSAFRLPKEGRRVKARAILTQRLLIRRAFSWQVRKIAFEGIHATLEVMPRQCAEQQRKRNVACYNHERTESFDRDSEETDQLPEKKHRKAVDDINAIADLPHINEWSRPKEATDRPSHVSRGAVDYREAECRRSRCLLKRARARYSTWYIISSPTAPENEHFLPWLDKHQQVLCTNPRGIRSRPKTSNRGLRQD
jgi:hypothetical protein